MLSTLALRAPSARVACMITCAVGASLVATVAQAPARDLLSRLMIELSLLQVRLRLVSLTDRGMNWLTVQRELQVLLGLERQRRLHGAGLIASPMEPPSQRAWRRGPLGRLLPSLLSRKATAPPPMAGGSELVFKDLVLVGGGHSHAHVLKLWGMNPEPGVQLTLVTRDVDTPYSGMLPGYVAGAYTWRECHIDLARLAAYAGARLIHAEACGIDTDARRVHLRGRPPISYDVLSIDIGSAPKPVATKPVAPKGGTTAGDAAGGDAAGGAAGGAAAGSTVTCSYVLRSGKGREPPTGAAPTGAGHLMKWSGLT